MCGFTGFLTKNNTRSRSEQQNIAEEMNNTLILRGPDAGDTWQDPDVSCVLGHRRLSIIDLSDEGAQPMNSNSGRYVIAYNGEIYNFLELRKILETRGITFRGRSDTEVILAAIEHWGLNQALQKFSGMFAFALWDRQERILHFARDHFGKKPLYVGWAGSSLIFGSELKALRAHPEFSPTLNTETIALFIRYGHVPAPYCIYENVWKLPPAHRLNVHYDTLSSGQNLRVDMEPFWSAEEQAKQARFSHHHNRADDNAILDDFEALLTQCIQDRMISDVPLGSFLSGGIDSSTVTALMQKISANPIKTFSIGFDQDGYNEAQHAQKIAQHLGTDHHELYVSQNDIINNVPALAHIYDEPFADASALPTLLLSKFARQSVTVALSGDGGDEILGGYNRHIQGPRLWNAAQKIPKFLHKPCAATFKSLPPKYWDTLIPFIPQFGTKIHKVSDGLSFDTQKDMYESFIQTFNDTDAQSLLLHGQILDHNSYKTASSFSFAESMMLSDALGYLPNDVLTKVDRATMAHSLEARSPLLDTRLFSFCWGIAEHLKINNGQGKILLRKTLERHIPKDLFDRPKQGFSPPIDLWLRSDLKDWAQDLLGKSDTIFDTKILQNLWDNHVNNRGNHGQQLWTVLMFQSWKDHWM